MRMTTKGQVTIPQHIREAAGCRPGTELEFGIDDAGVVRVHRHADQPEDSALTRAGQGGRRLVNPIIFAEVSIAFDRLEDVDDLLPEAVFHRADLP